MTEDFFRRRLSREQRARQEAELLLERKSAELYAANQKLLNMNQQLQQQKQALASARDAALESSRLKSEFLANMSHEIRTPMNGIMGMTELVLNSPLTADQRECISIARGSATALLSLINDILDLSKIEAGYLELQEISFSIRALLNETIQPFAYDANRKGLEFCFEPDPGVPDQVIGDPCRVRQVVINLIGNAIKFTASGRVWLRITAEQAAAHAAILHFEVCDTGIGIPAERQDAIFKPFIQGDGSIGRQFGGTGLGLAIVSRLVEKMGGKISVESTPGKGSAFRFNVKLAVDAAVPDGKCPGTESLDASRPDSKPPARPLRVLVAEDHPVNQRVVMEMLRRAGHSGTLAANGRQAVDLFRSQPVDIVLMDIQMPEIDGYEATALIRATEAAAKTARVPIVALTAHAMRGDAERCLEAGMDDYLPKPIAFADLLRKLSSLTSKAVFTPTTASPQSAPATPDYRTWPDVPQSFRPPPC